MKIEQAWNIGTLQYMWDDEQTSTRIREYEQASACSGGRIVSCIIYCWLVWCERKTLFSAGNLRSFTSKRTGFARYLPLDERENLVTSTKLMGSAADKSAKPDLLSEKNTDKSG